jgi:starvation-inducible DNA-binding protein
MNANPGIQDHDVEEIATLLNTLLADEYALYTKTRNAHWNIDGPNFHELHEFFETQYETLDEMIDEIADRVRSLGYFALGSLKDFLSVTHLGEENHDFSDPKQIILTLFNNHETIIGIIRNDITPVSGKYRDLETCDFVTGLMGKHEKMAWMLRSYLA